MSITEQMQIFEEKQVRTVWDDEKEKWFFSIADVVSVLTDSTDPKQYIKKMKMRDTELASNWGTICTLVEMKGQDGKMRQQMTADLTGVFRLIQSIPSKKAEPFKRWMAQVAAQRVDQFIDPELSIEQAILDYQRKGYDETWITRRIKTIEIRKGLTDEWKRGGVTQQVDFAFLTDLMSKTWSGLTTKEYKHFKGLRKENLRDNMTNMELLLNALAEESATELSKERNPQGLSETASTAQEGAEVAKTARDDFEKRLGHSIISSERAIDHTLPQDQLPLNKQSQNKQDPFFEETE